MNLKLVMYTSLAVPASPGSQIVTGLSSVVKQCKNNNPSNNISGMLYYSHGRYLQIIEGEPAKVDRLVDYIFKDSRHTDCLVQLNMSISKRSFNRWEPLLNMSVTHDPNIRHFLARYSAQLKAMSADRRMAFNHFFKKTILSRKTKVTQAAGKASLNVFGNKVLHVSQTPDFSTLTLTPLMLNVCRLLERQARSLDELVAEYGPSKRDEIMLLLRSLNQKGMLHYGEEPSLTSKNRKRIDIWSEART